MQNPDLKEAYKSLDGLTEYFNGWAKKAREGFYIRKINRMADARLAEIYLEAVQHTREGLDAGVTGFSAYGRLHSLWIDNLSVARSFSEANWFERAFNGAAEKAVRFQEMSNRLEETIEIIRKAVNPNP